MGVVIRQGSLIDVFRTLGERLLKAFGGSVVVATVMLLMMLGGDLLASIEHAFIARVGVIGCGVALVSRGWVVENPCSFGRTLAYLALGFTGVVVGVSPEAAAAFASSTLVSVLDMLV